MFKRHNRCRRHFTLIELLAVITIMAIIVSIALVALRKGGVQEAARTIGTQVSKCRNMAMSVRKPYMMIIKVDTKGTPEPADNTVSVFAPFLALDSSGAELTNSTLSSKLDIISGSEQAIAPDFTLDSNIEMQTYKPTGSGSLDTTVRTSTSNVYYVVKFNSNGIMTNLTVGQTEDDGSGNQIPVIDPDTGLQVQLAALGDPFRVIGKADTELPTIRLQNKDGTGRWTLSIHGYLGKVVYE